MDDPLLLLVKEAVSSTEQGRAVTVRGLASALGWSYGTTHRLWVEARRRGWLEADGSPSPEGLVVSGRV